MSYDLGVWASVRPNSAEIAGGIDRRLLTGDISDLENASMLESHLTVFLHDLTSLYPQIDDVNEEDVDECPWAIAFDQSAAHLIICVSWSFVDEVVPLVKRLAFRHHLTVFDPQLGEVS